MSIGNHWARFRAYVKNAGASLTRWAIASSVSLVLINCSSTVRQRDAQTDNPNAKLNRAISVYYNALQKKQFGKVYGMVSKEYWDSYYKNGAGPYPDVETQQAEFLEDMHRNIYGHKDFKIVEWKVLKQRISGNKAYILMNLFWKGPVSTQPVGTLLLYDVWIYSQSRWKLFLFLEPAPPDDWPEHLI